MHNTHLFFAVSNGHISVGREGQLIAEDASQEISGSATFKEGRDPFPNYWI